MFVVARTKAQQIQLGANGMVLAMAPQKWELVVRAARVRGSFGQQQVHCI